MQREDVIQLAREAMKQEPREDWNSTAWVFGDEALERFAAAVEQRTLERAAAVCDELEDKAEESRAFKAYADAQKQGDMDYEISRGKHWMTVNMYNIAIRKGAAAIRSLKENHEP